MILSHFLLITLTCLSLYSSLQLQMPTLDDSSAAEIAAPDDSSPISQTRRTRTSSIHESLVPSSITEMGSQRDQLIIKDNSLTEEDPIRKVSKQQTEIYTDSLIKAHAIFMVISWMLILPNGLILLIFGEALCSSKLWNIAYSQFFGFLFHFLSMLTICIRKQWRFDFTNPHGLIGYTVFFLSVFNITSIPVVRKAKGKDSLHIIEKAIVTLHYWSGYLSFAMSIVCIVYAVFVYSMDSEMDQIICIVAVLSWVIVFVLQFLFLSIKIKMPFAGHAAGAEQLGENGHYFNASALNAVLVVNARLNNRSTDANEPLPPVLHNNRLGSIFATYPSTSGRNNQKSDFANTAQFKIINSLTMAFQVTLVCLICGIMGKNKQVLS